MMKKIIISENYMDIDYLPYVFWPLDIILCWSLMFEQEI